MIYGEDSFNQILLAVIRDKYRHPHYERMCRIAKEGAVHIYGEVPEDLLNRARPREDEDVKNYRISNYESTTKGAAGKAITIISKIFNPTLSSIIFPKTKQAEELRDYTMFYFPVFNSIMAFNKDVLLKKMIADPNAVQAVKPQRIPDNDAQKIKPIIVIYGTENVWNYDLDHFLINVGEEVTKEGIYYIFEYYDFEKYMKFKAWASNNNTLHLEIVEEYPHNFKDDDGEGEIPAWFLRGKPISCPDGSIVFESFFADAFPSWNLNIIHESDVMGAYINHLFPQKYETTEDCGFRYPYESQFYPCRGGRIKYPGKREGEQMEMDCPSCGGSGRKAVTSPYGVYQYNKSKLEEMPSTLAPVGYITVPVDATKMLEERADRMVKKGSHSINMDVEDEIGENQSGVAKTIDRSAQYDTIYDIGGVVFDIHIPNQFYFINKYKNAVEASSLNRNVDENLPQVNKPVNLNILSVAELINNFKAGKDSGLDRNFLQAKMVEILSRDLETNPEMKRYYLAIINLDPLFGLDYDVIDSEVSKGTVRKVDSSIHFNLKSFVDRAISEHKDFLTMDKPAQLEILEGYAEELIESEKPKLDANMFTLEQDQEQDQETDQDAA